MVIAASQGDILLKHTFSWSQTQWKLVRLVQDVVAEVKRFEDAIEISKRINDH